MRATPRSYFSELDLKKRLNGRNTQPNRRLGPSFGAPWAFSSARGQGRRQGRELIAEITVEMAMVTANCL